MSPPGGTGLRTTPHHGAGSLTTTNQPSATTHVEVGTQQPPPLLHRWTTASVPRLWQAPPTGHKALHMMASPARQFNANKPPSSRRSSPPGRDQSPPPPRRRSPPRDRTPPPPRQRSPPRDRTPPPPRQRSPPAAARMSTPHTWSGATVMTSPHGPLPTPFSETSLQPAPAGAASAQRTAYARRPSSTVLKEMEDTPAARSHPPLSSYQPPPFTRSDVSDWRRRQQGEPQTQTSRPQTGEVGVAGRTDGPRHPLAGEPSALSMHQTIPNKQRGGGGSGEDRWRGPHSRLHASCGDSFVNTYGYRYGVSQRYR